MGKNIRGRIVLIYLGLWLLITTLVLLLRPDLILGHAVRQPLFLSFNGTTWALSLSLVLRYFYFRDDLIRAYKCSGTRNNGSETEFQGELLHHFGEPGNLEGNEVWIHRKNSKKCGRPALSQDATLWGPYSTDCTNPGHYKATFRVKFDPGTNSRTEYSELLLFQFDVLCFRQTFDSYSGSKGEQLFLGKRFLRFSDFSPNKWITIDVPFYSNGTGMLEYRALAFNEGNLNDRPNNFSQLKHDFTFYFDWVKIYKIEEGRLF